MRKIMASLDIGYNSIKFIVTETSQNNVYVLSSSITPNDSYSLETGFNLDMLETLLKKIISDTEGKLGIPIRKTILTIPTSSASFTINYARTNIKNEEHLVSVSDVSRVINLAGKNVIQENMELVNITPLYFILDNGEKTLEPVNTFSKTLEVKALITSSLKSDIYRMIEVLEHLGVSVVDISYDEIGEYFNSRDEETDKSNGIIVDIGYLSTRVSLFNKGILVNTGDIKVGGLNILKDISYVYKVSLSTAKEIYNSLGVASPKNASNLEKIEIKDKNGDKVIINQYNLSEVIASRIKEILSMAKKQINTLTKRKISYIICTGGIANLRDFDLLCIDVFSKNVKVSHVSTIGIRDNRYASSYGLIKWYDYNAKLKNYDYSILSLEEQEEFSREEKETKNSSNSIIGKVFDYFFEN